MRGGDLRRAKSHVERALEIDEIFNPRMIWNDRLQLTRLGIALNDLDSANSQVEALRHGTHHFFDEAHEAAHALHSCAIEPTPQTRAALVNAIQHWASIPDPSTVADLIEDMASYTPSPENREHLIGVAHRLRNTDIDLKEALALCRATTQLREIS
jgi:hypothetical protein